MAKTIIDDLKLAAAVDASSVKTVRLQKTLMFAVTIAHSSKLEQLFYGRHQTTQRTAIDGAALFINKASDIYSPPDATKPWQFSDIGKPGTGESSNYQFVTGDKLGWRAAWFVATAAADLVPAKEVQKFLGAEAGEFNILTGADRANDNDYSHVNPDGLLRAKYNADGKVKAFGVVARSAYDQGWGKPGSAPKLPLWDAAELDAIEKMVGREIFDRETPIVQAVMNGGGIMKPTKHGYRLQPAKRTA